MLKIKLLPSLMAIVSKIDVKPVQEVLAGMDFANAKNGAEAKKELEARKVEIGFAVLGAITPQLGKISDDVIKLIADNKGVSIEEAGALDLVEELKALASDAGIMGFFKSALQKKVRGQK